MSNFANLETFTLGDAELGAGYGEITESDSIIHISDTNSALITALKTEAIIRIIDSRQVTLNASLADALNIPIEKLLLSLRLAEALAISTPFRCSSEITTTRTESITANIEKIKYNVSLIDALISAISERLCYPNRAQVGVLARVVLSLDITSTEFCTTVLESGMSIYVNQVASRAFLFPKQSGQKFNNGKNILPGDAAMFSCPTLDLELGDEIYHNYIYYTIIAFKDEFIGGNWIYRKSGLRRTSPINGLPQVVNVVASANYEGKTTIVWDAIDQTVYPNLGGFVIGRIPNTLPIGTLYPHAITTILNDPPAETIGITDARYFLVGTAPTGLWAGKTGYTAKWNEITGLWIFDGAFALNDLIFIISQNNYYYLQVAPTWLPIPWEIVETTKNNSFTDKNLYANYPYVYVIWTHDLYGNKAYPSVPIVTPYDNTPPPTPGGLR